MEGFGDIYQGSVSKQKKRGIAADVGTVEYWEQVREAQKSKSKIANSLLVAQKIIEEGPDSVPELLSDLINKSRELARRTG